MMPRGRVRGILTVVLALALGGVACATSPDASKRSEKPTNYFDSGWLPVNDSPTRGDDDGLVTVVVFNDLLCEGCGETARRVEKLRSQRDSVRVVHKFYPLGEKAHRMAARAAAFAEEHEKFWPMYDAIVEHRKAVRKNPESKLEELAEKVGFDADAFADRIDPPGSRKEADALAKRIQRDVEQGRKLGLEGPPAVFVNGRLLSGEGERAELRQTFEAARSEVDRLLKGGVASSMLYQTAAGLAYRRQGLNRAETYGGSLKAGGGGGGGGLKVGRGPGSDLVDSKKVPIGDSPVRGPTDAPVTIVAYADHQCPFSKKGHARLQKVRENYPNKVRIVFEHYPLPFHKKAKPASRATLAALEQGTEYYWKMHDRLFENQQEWKNEDLAELTADWAEQMGMDRAQFERDLRNNKERYNQVVDDHMSRGKKLGVKGTPHFLINGERLSGAQPYNKFESVIEAKLDQVDELLRGGVKREEIYAKAVAKNFEVKDDPEPKKKTKVEYVPVGEKDAVRGASADEALVTFVMFADFQCPFSDKSVPTVDKLVDNYGDRVRFVYKHLPLGFHKQARPAARAAIAAQKQGKFWEMHDLLFENQKRLKEGDEVFVEFAEELELDVQQFERDMKSDEAKERVEQDQKLAKEIGAQGTPNFWINGVNVVGAQPYRKFEEVVEQQLERAKKVKKEQDVSGKALYKAAVELNKEKVGGDSGEREADAKPDPDPENRVDTSPLKVEGSPTRGPKDAPIVIYEFSDFQCPYCKKARPRVEKLLEEYEGKIRHVHKHYPLPFHQQAMPAAKAAMAAQKQGKFWAMYDKMFEEQEKLGNDGQFEKWAEELGLNVEKFRSDMEEISDSDVKKDMEMGKKVGVKGTPAFYINDRRLVGAQPYNKFKTIVEEELEKK